MCLPCLSKKQQINNIGNIEKKYFVDGSTEYYLDDSLHNNNDAPAVVNELHQEWWLHGLRHRKNKPAILYKDGSKEYWFYGMRHRDNNKPAVILKDEGFNVGFYTLEYWFYGKLHRDNGPAIEKSSGEQEYWIHGKRIK